jgi:hypothetical protein
VFELLFKYPLSEFRFGELIYLRGWPVSVMAVLWVSAAILLGALLWRRSKVLSVRRILVIAALQFAMWSLVLWVVWQPALLIKSLRSGENNVAVLLDHSASMTVKDPETSRTAQAQVVLNGAVFQGLARNYPLRRYVFAAEATTVDSFDSLPESTSSTRIGNSVLQVLNASRTTPLGAVVLISDGSENSGQLDPAQVAEISRFGVPVHVIGIGRQQMPEDVELESILLPTKTLPGSKLAARVAVRHDGAGIARIRVTDGDKLLAAKEIVLPAETTLTTQWLEFDMNDRGYRDLKFELIGADQEQERRNNIRTQLVNVASEVASVLYVEGEPRWEYKFIRRAVDADQSVRLVSMLRTTPNGLYRQGVEDGEELKDGFPTTRETLFKYDALIIGNVQAAYFSKVQQQLIQEFVNLRGGHALFLGGSKTLGEGGWANTALNEVLPVKLPTNGKSFHRSQVQAMVTARGQRESWLKFSEDPAENAKQWKAMPMLADYQDLGALKPAASALMNVKVQNKEQPVLVTQAYGHGHATVFATGGSWRWQMSLPLEDQHHEFFWRQLMRSLVMNVSKPVELIATETGEGLHIRANLKDRSFQPQQTLQVNTLITAPVGEAINLNLKPVADQPGVYEAKLDASEAGNYFIELTARRGSEVVGTARTAVHHDKDLAEYFSLRQDRGLLERLAVATGGQYWSADDLTGLPEAIRFSPAGITEQQTKTLWDMPINFILLMLLKASEWILRRRWGVI